MISEIYMIIKGFINRLKQDNVGAFSAQAAFFLIMSIVPFLSLLLTLIKYLPISRHLVSDTILQIIPTPFEPVVNEILLELFNKTNSAVLSISAVIAIWSASKGILAVIRGLNAVYHVDDNRNYFLLRFLSAIYTLIFAVAILISLLLLVFSNQIYYVLQKDFPVAAGVISVFIKQKLILSFCILTLFFMSVYKLVNIKSYNIFTLIPGSILASVSWIVTSYIFSVYVDKFSGISYTYGSLATLTLFMFWVYVCMYILFVGAEINSYFKIYFDNVKKYIKNRAGQ